MTKEQEVIEYFKKQIDICLKNAEICDDNNFDEEATYLREESYMLETVLNMLKEKDKEIYLMAEHIQNGCDFDNRIKTKEEIKQFYKRKATNDG